jgi:hypothetical protein
MKIVLTGKTTYMLLVSGNIKIFEKGSVTEIAEEEYMLINRKEYFASVDSLNGSVTPKNIPPAEEPPLPAPVTAVKRNYKTSTKTKRK